MKVAACWLVLSKILGVLDAEESMTALASLHGAQTVQLGYSDCAPHVTLTDVDCLATLNTALEGNQVQASHTVPLNMLHARAHQV